MSEQPQTSRRIFISRVAAAGGAILVLPARAQTAAKVDEKDPQAAALGYSADTGKVDAKKYPKHASSQKCGNCQLYSGKTADAAGPCSLFQGRQVAANGWCSAWVKKAG